MDTLLVIPILISFLTALFVIPLWIKKAHAINLVWDDMNKTNGKKVAGSGGIIVVTSFLLGVLAFIAYRTFYLHSSFYLIEILSTLVVVLSLAGIGIIDDLLGWQKGGLSKRTRIIAIILATIPLIVINAGKGEVSLPFLGMIDLGLIYVIFLIPIGIVGAATTFNMLAGFNGLEAGQGILMLGALSIVAYFTGSPWLAIVALCMASALFAFLFYNFYPAEVFPGNVMTYAVGGLTAIVAILGDFEKIAVFFFIPYFCEVILKSRGKLKKQSFGKPNKDGSLELRYDKLYSVNHVAIKLLQKANIEVTERKVACFVWAFQIIVIIVGFVIFREGIFGI